MTQFFAATGFLALLVLATVVVALILFLIFERFDAKKRKKCYRYNAAHLVINDYFKVRSTTYKCQEFEYYRGNIYVHGKPLEATKTRSGATGCFLNDYVSTDGRSVSIFDFGSISEILDRSTIK